MAAQEHSSLYDDGSWTPAYRSPLYKRAVRMSDPMERTPRDISGPIDLYYTGEQVSDYHDTPAPALASASEKAETLETKVQKLEVACAELKGLPASRSVYLKQGAVFFRSDLKILTTMQQNLLEKAKADLKRSEKAHQ